MPSSPWLGLKSDIWGQVTVLAEGGSASSFNPIEDENDVIHASKMILAQIQPKKSIV